MTFALCEDFQQKLYNKLRELRDHFFARHFLNLKLLPTVLEFFAIKKSL